MGARAGFLVWVGVGLCGTSLVSSACVEQQSCTTVGCSSTEALSFSAPIAQLAETEISACRQQYCWRGQLTAADLATGTGSSEHNLRSDDATSERMTCSIETHSEPGIARVTVTWWASEQAPAIGDMLSATFRDSAGNTVLARSGSVASLGEEYYPNGKDCDTVGCRASVAKLND